MFLVLLAVIMLLASAGFAGTVAGKEMLDGCKVRKTVAFDPWPEALDENGTYWLVLHHEGSYFVRQLGPVEGREIVVVPERPGMVARIGSVPATKSC